MTGLHVRTARPDDEAAIGELLRKAADWLATRGTDQWQNPDLSHQDPTRTVAGAITRGQAYVVLDDKEIVGAFLLDDYADPDFWQPADHPHEAKYLHRMVRRIDPRIHGVGDAILGHALAVTQQSGRRWLRLDAWRTNEALHAYYQDKGFRHVRTVDVPHRGSGALFELPADQPLLRARSDERASTTS